MPRTKAQFEAMRNATREKINRAALRLFAQKGLAGTNVQEIADLCGISVGLLYRHYPTKEAIFDGLAADARARMDDIVNQLTAPFPPRAKILALTERLTADLKNIDTYDSFVLFIAQSVTGGRENSLSMQELVEGNIRLTASIAEVIRQGQHEGGFREGDPMELAMVYISAVQGLGHFKTLLKDRFRIPLNRTLNDLILMQSDAKE